MSGPATRRMAVVTFFAVALVTFAVDWVAYTGPAWGEDVAQHWVASRLLSEGLDPYEEGALRSRGEELGLIRPGAPSHHFLERHHYPPLGLLVGYPMSGLDYRGARIAWLLVSTFAALGCVPLVLRVSSLEPGSDAALLFAGAFLLFLPVRTALGLGQTDVFLFLLLLLGVELDRNGRPWIAGAPLALAALLKLIPAAWILYFLAFRRTRTVASFAAWAIGMTIASLAVVPASVYASFFRSQWLFAGGAEGWQRYEPNNLSLTAWVFKALAFASGGHAYERVGEIAGPVLAVLVLGFLFVLLVRRHRPGTPPDPAGLGLLCAGIALVSPLTWQHHLVVLALPLGVSLRAAWSAAESSAFLRRFLIPFLLIGVLDPRFPALRALTAGWSKPMRDAAWAAPALLATLGILWTAWAAWRSFASPDGGPRRSSPPV